VLPPGGALPPGGEGMPGTRELRSTHVLGDGDNTILNGPDRS
jgi:hypothetical protein